MAELNARRTGERSVAAPHRGAATATRGHGAMAADPVADHASAIGNLEMLRRLDAVGVRPKLDVSSPGDAHEVEADRVAEPVMSMQVDRAEATPTDEEEQSVATKLDVARAEATPTDEEEQVATRLDRAVEPAKDEEEQVATRLDRAVEPAKDEEEQVATRLDRAVEPAKDEEEQVATKADAASAMTPAVEAGINRSRAGGAPLDAGARRFFEPRFGRDLSDTKVHTDATAARLASDLNAQAFTVGRDIYMGAGRYRPGTESGRALLAHELTHTVQQQPGAKIRRRPARIAVPNPTSTSRRVQRAVGGGGHGGGAAAAQDPGVINDGGTPTITYEQKLKVPPFKANVEHRAARFAAHPPVHAHDSRRGDPSQSTVWDASLPDVDI